MTDEQEHVAAAFLSATAAKMSIVQMDKLKIGYGHTCWRIQTQKHGDYLLKISTRIPTTYHFTNEIHAQQLMIEHRQPVPKIVAICAAPNELHEHFYIQSWLPGEDGEAALAKMTPQQSWRFAYEFGQAVANMHQIEAASFSEDILNKQVYPSWKSLCAQRLKKLVEKNIQVKVLPDSVVRTIEERCSHLIATLPADLLPVFTHRDLYLRNTLVQDGKFKALLDFESARFYDGLWDFAKLMAWVFHEHPAIRPSFLQGYVSVLPWHASSAERIFLYQGLEYLAAFPYFGAERPDKHQLHHFEILLKEWLSSSPASTQWEVNC